jgi:hypothetical protein
MKNEDETIKELAEKLQKGALSDADKLIALKKIESILESIDKRIDEI